MICRCLRLGHGHVPVATPLITLIANARATLFVAAIRYDVRVLRVLLGEAMLPRLWDVERSVVNVTAISLGTDREP